MPHTEEYDIAKCSYLLIKPHTKNHILNSTQAFVNKLNQFHFGSNDTLIGFNMESLFINVSLHETIDIICNYMYSSNYVQLNLLMF